MIGPSIYDSLYSFASRMANEGIPIGAIVRVTKCDSELVRDQLNAARAVGDIAEVPRADWPMGQFGNRAPFVSFKAEDEQMVFNAIRLFKMTRLQASLLAILLKRTEATKDVLHKVIEANRKPNTRETDPKMVDVVICHLRKKLKKFGLKIDTLWACGYYMKPEQRVLASKMLRDFGDQQIVEKL
jgi:hypothetical protein